MNDELPEIVLYASAPDDPVLGGAQLSDERWPYYETEDGGWDIVSAPHNGRVRWWGWRNWRVDPNTGGEFLPNTGAQTPDDDEGYDSAEQVLRAMARRYNMRITIDPSKVWRTFAQDGTFWNGKTDDNNPPAKRLARTNWRRLVDADATRGQHARRRTNAQRIFDMHFAAPW